MKPTRALHDLGQSLWLDNITRELLDSGALARYIGELDVTGLTSNPTIFDQAIRSADTYDDAIRRKIAADKSTEALFIELALEDLTRAADLFRPIHDATGGTDGWVSMEVSPLLAYDTAGSIEQAKQLHKQAQRPNMFVKIPGTPAGLGAIEEAVFAGVPINVTLLFSCEQYLAAAQAYMRAIERRIAGGLDPNVTSVASLFVSRWDVAIKDKVPADCEDAVARGDARARGAAGGSHARDQDRAVRVHEGRVQARARPPRPVRRRRSIRRGDHQPRLPAPSHPPPQRHWQQQDLRHPRRSR